MVLTTESGKDSIREAIRSLHGQAGGLTRVHRTHPALYARARRAYGSWREAVAAAGLDYAQELDRSLRAGLLMRDQRRALWHAVARFLAEDGDATDESLERDRPELSRRVRRCWGSLAEAKRWAAGNRARG
jgi:hypothetical protein